MRLRQLSRENPLLEVMADVLKCSAVVKRLVESIHCVHEACDVWYNNYELIIFLPPKLAHYVMGTPKMSHVILHHIFLRSKLPCNLKSSNRTSNTSPIFSDSNCMSSGAEKTTIDANDE